MPKSNRNRPIVLLLLLAAATAALVPSKAEAGEVEDRKRAREVYERGLRLYKTGEFVLAAEQFKEAYLLKPDATFLFNMGQAYRQVGDRPRALLAYRNYLKDSPDAPNRKDVEQFIYDLEHPSAPASEKTREPAPPSKDKAPPRNTPAPSPAAGPNVRPLPLADYPYPPPPPPGYDGPIGASRSRLSNFSFQVSLGAGFRYAYGAPIPGGELGLRLGTKTERAALYGSLRLFAGEAIPGVTAVVFSPGFVGQGRIGRFYLGGGVHFGVVSMAGPVGAGSAILDLNLGASVDLDVMVARFGRTELLVGISGGADLLVAGSLSTNDGTPVLATSVVRIGFGM